MTGEQDHRRYPVEDAQRLHEIRFVVEQWFHLGSHDARFLFRYIDDLTVERDALRQVLSEVYGNALGPNGEDNDEDDTWWSQDLGLCPYYMQDGRMGGHGTNTCWFGCETEPQCQTCRPDNGWLWDRVRSLLDNSIEGWAEKAGESDV